MTIPGLIIINMLIGSTIAFSARIQIRTLQRPVLSSRYFITLMLLEGIVLMPVGIYFYTFYKDWSWMYLIDTATSNPGIGIMAIISYPFAATLGYLVGHYSARGGGDWVTVTFMVTMLVGSIGLLAVASEQLRWVGTYEQFHRDTGLRAISETSMMPSTILTVIGMGVCWSYSVFRFVQEGRLSLRAL